MRKLYFLGVICIAVIFASCGTGNKFASSFGKRRYTKGYYVDAPSSVKANVFEKANVEPVAAHQRNITTAALAVKQTDMAKVAGVSLMKGIRIRSRAHINNITAAPVHFIAAEVQVVNKDDTKKGGGWKDSSETNYLAIAGFIICCIGVVLTIIATNFTVLSGIMLGIGVVLSFYSLFLNKIYWNWLAVVGISFAIILFVLIVL